MTEIRHRRSERDSLDPVSKSNPFPVDVNSIVTVVGKTYWIEHDVPGIGTGAAYAASDAFGSMFVIPVPASGTIQSARFYDLDNEGISKELWLFRGAFTATADNAAFSVSVADNLLVESVILISVFSTANGTQIGRADGLGISYVAPDKRLYCQIKTSGADNIAAGAIPRVALRILPDGE